MHRYHMTYYQCHMTYYQCHMTYFDIGGICGGGKVREDNLTLVQVPVQKLSLDKVTSRVSVSIRTWRGWYI